MTLALIIGAVGLIVMAVALASLAWSAVGPLLGPLKGKK